MEAESARNEQLLVAVQHRTTIGITLGILMERFDLDSDEAFAHLCAISSRQNRKLYDIAVEINVERTVPE